ncbi:hypothetical protein DF19_26515 [Streptomyces olindensis]|nr:hypothetical protein DF19_26515 [Streptomyces olindensis]
MIQPEKIPQFTGNLEQLETDYADLKKDAGHVRDAGGDIHSRFQGLSAFYHAPEAERLFATTKPVKEKADAFADDLEKVSGALSSYATEIRPLVAKLKQLKADAAAFVSSVKDDDEWEYDEDKVDEHNKLRDEITATVAAFWAAERTCHNKITALWGGTQMVAGDGSDKKNQYGFNAEDMKNAKLPWGDPVEEKHKWYEVGHWVKSFVWDGLIVDGVWGTIKGLGTLVGFGGWEAMGQAWKGLAQLATGLVITAIPGAQAWFWTASDKDMPSWLRDSRTAMKETGKALVAWDQWGKNPARAAGAVTFNVLTTVFTGGAGAAASGAGKAGAVAKALSVAGKAGRVIDPMTYITKGAGAGLSKIGDITKGLKGVGNIDIPALPENAVTLPEGTVRLPDGTVRLPEGAALPDGATTLPDGNVRLPDDAPALPEGTTKLPTEDGAPARYYDPDGNILDEHGNVLQHAQDGPGDIVDQPDTGNPAAGADAPRVDSPAHEPALVGAGTHTAEQAGQHIRLGDSLDNNLGDVGRVGDDVPTTPAVQAGGDVPTVHAGGDLPHAGGAGDNLPGGSAGNHLPGGSADHMPSGTAHEHGAGPSASHETPHTEHIGHDDHPQEIGHAAPAGGSIEVPTRGQGGGPPGEGNGGFGHSHEPQRVDYSEGDERASVPTGRMQPDQEASVAEQLAAAKMAPQDIEKSLAGLRKSEYGAGIAKHISNGNLADVPGYADLLSQCKQVSKGSDMTPAVYMAMEHATDLQARGVEGLGLELKKPEVGLDLDVLVRSGDRIEYGVQLKDVKSATGINSATKGIAAKQLRGPIDGQKVAILDVHDTKAALTSEILERVAARANMTEATFVLRFEDGSITVPANGPTYP